LDIVTALAGPVVGANDVNIIVLYLGYRVK
jgi:hypothetical protein